MRSSATRVRAAIVLMAIAVTAAGCATAREIEERIGQEVDERVDRGVDEVVEGGADEAEEGVRGVISGGSDGPPAAGEQAAGEQAAGAGDASTAGPADPETSVLDVGGEAWANYDFVPGDRVLFFEDFEDDPPGNFPRRLDFRSGNMEVVEWRDGLYLRSRGDAAFQVGLPEALSERFTLEFSIHVPDGAEIFVVPEVPQRSMTYYERAYLSIDGRDVGIRDHRNGGAEAYSDIGRGHREGFVPVRMMADGSYVKVYAGGSRVANIPNADLARGDSVRFEVDTRGNNPVYFDDLRLAEGGRRITHDALMRDGRIVTRAILFETGSARVLGESTRTIADIARVLERHPDLDLRIEGHTDSRGSEQANRSLSEERAAAVRTALIEGYGIDGARLTAVGLGESRPIASNDTAEGRQSNRRVELVVPGG